MTLQTWAIFMDGDVFCFHTKQEAEDYVVETNESLIEEGFDIIEYVDPPEQLTASTDSEFMNMLRYVSEGLQ